MGNALQRNRFWWYRSLYDDYWLRELRLSFIGGAFLWLPFYWWGIHYNREIETFISHKNYFNEVGPLRNRLTHSMIFEEFEICLEKWKNLEEEHKNNPQNFGN